MENRLKTGAWPLPKGVPGAFLDRPGEIMEIRTSTIAIVAASCITVGAAGA